MGMGEQVRKRVSRTHRDSVTRLLRATGLANVPEEAPLVSLVKELARQMDVDPPSSRVTQAYLSALKDVRRVLNDTVRKPVRTRQDPAPKPEPVAPVEIPENVSKLETFKKKHGVTA